MLPREDLLQGSRRPEELAALIDQAEQALRTWQPVWTGFVAADLCEEADQRLGSLSELRLAAAGGWPQAERRRLLLQRAELAAAPQSPGEAAPLMGLVVSGNFLFDPAEPGDVRSGLLAAGAEAGELGDIWIRGDRGAQLIATPELAARLHGQPARVRTVEVQLEALPVEQLQLPAQRQPKQLSSVEASLRLDAVGSAGFGLSRSRMAELVRSGAVRLNWQPVSSPSKELAVGDRLRLEGRGELELLEVQPTKRERWRVVLRRS
ncbi:photosystem II S4 domain protein [Synechococcus sp. GreenBA-s]|nr:photosystem II S4 domain protein [Synechococcus sp. GreenBA-s]